jgi:EpsD family peptidyl-prolyl cis-trans isomerase
LGPSPKVNARPRQATYLVAWIALALMLGGCGPKKDDASTQIAAKVNKEEISVHQINYLLQRQAGLKADQLDAVSRTTLDALIDQELALQAAIDLRIDRDPGVLMAIESSRRDIIARAYADRLSEGVRTPSPDEVKQYYRSRPALFAQRRLYTLVDAAVQAKSSEIDSVRGSVLAAHNPAEVAAVLRNAKLRFGTRQVTMGAEELPMEAVDSMSELREGQSHLIAGPTGLRILTIVSAQQAPVSEEEARPMIERFLMLEHKRQVVEAQIKSLRSVAHIEYRGKFAQTSTEPEKGATVGEGRAATNAAEPAAQNKVALGKAAAALK